MNPQTIFKAALLGAACLASLHPARGAEFFLRAGAVTNTMPDGAQVVQWGFARDTAFGALDGAITVPGPVLVVAPNDPVLTIRLDNDLPEPISIVINGQFSTNAAPMPVRNPDGRVRSFVQEAAPGNTAPVTYTWPNVRPGTFLYASASHSQIQIPMGLYGAMKKDTNNGVAYPGVNYASDVVLVLSEIDPVLNDAVATDNFGPGKARTSAAGYQAKYFLINGRAYTNGQPPILAGDPGRTNLLRLLNASLETHVPILDGLHLRQVAEDGNQYPFPRTAYSLHLPPQKTLDALVLNPPAGLLPFYDRRLGLVSGTNLSGGMLTFLSYASSPPLIVSQPAPVNSGEGAVAAFTVTASGTTPLSYQWRRNGANLANGTGIAGATTPSLTLGPLLLAQAGNYAIVVTNISGSVTSTVAPLAILSRADAVDAPALTWTSGGNLPWLAQTSVTHDTIDAAQSGVITDGQESWIETIVLGPGTLSFWWKASTETNSDRVRLYLNGSAQTGFLISGETDWQPRSIAVASGSQTFRWRYDKSGSTSVGQDRVWLDQVVFTPPTPPAPDTNPPAAVVNLAVISTTSSSATLSWTSPGDDGTTGTAASYDLRYSTALLTEANFAAASQATGEPVPALAGTAQGMTVTGLIPGTPYFFALKTSDEVPNISPLSNVAPGSTTAGPPPGTPTNLIALNSVWRYLDDGTDQSNAWRTVSYVDSAWASGPAELGYGDGDEATVVGFGADPDKKYITTYFRQSFTVANPAAYASLFIRLLRDDGAVVYLNGVEIFRSNMPTGTINYLTEASGGANETTYYTATIPASGLVAGANVLAVEIHQSNSGSGDISFNLQLTGTLAP